MGKDKGSQRTKGNQKPSSSGRTAELLGGVSGFIGFSALGDLGYVPAASNGSQDDDTTISSNFRVALRKMSKKDSTTKIKALQEFEVLCENEDLESIKTVLAFWPRLYSKLSIDTERRVREAAQVSHGALTRQVGKQLAPYLKGIMPTWLIAMCDPHTSAATSATKAFKDAFSEEKRAGVMIFCCKEIFDYIGDILFIQTADTLSDSKITSPEDMENKYMRVLSCSLSGLGLFLWSTSSTTDKKHEVIAWLKPLLNNDKFWTLSKHKNCFVRSGWFSLIKNIFQYDLALMEAYVPQLGQTIFPAMADTDSSVLSHVWIVFLHFTVGLKDKCWSACSSPRSLLGRIFSVLQNGCHGNPSELCPQLLPILSVIPDTVIDDRPKFYLEFLRAITTGIRKERVMVSTRDLNAMIKALYECIKYISKENVCSMETWDTIMKYQVVGLINSSWNENLQLSKSILYIEISNLLNYWNVWAQDNTNKPLCELLTVFWQLLLPEFHSLLERNNTRELDNMRKFFTVLKDPNTPSKTGGVKFTDQISFDLPSLTQKSVTIKDQVNRDIFICHCSKQISVFIKDCYDKYKESEESSFFQCFATLLSLYPSKDIFSKLIVVQDNCEGGNLALEVIKQQVVPILKEQNNQNTPSALKIFTSLYLLLSQEEQFNMLLTIQDVMHDAELLNLIQEVQCGLQSGSVTAKWLKSSQLNHRIMTSVKKLFQYCSTFQDAHTHYNHYQNNFELIAFVLGHESIFSLEFMRDIMVEIQSNLPEINKEFDPDFKLKSEGTLYLICNLTEKLFGTSVPIPGLSEFLHKLFLLLCYNSCSLSPSLYKYLQSSSIHNMTRPSLFEDDVLFHNSFAEVKRAILHPNCSYQCAINLADSTFQLLSVFYKIKEQNEDDGILLDQMSTQTALDIILPTEGEWLQMENKLSPLYLAPDILNDSLTFGDFLLPSKMLQDPEWNQDFVRTAVFLSNLLIKLCSLPASDTCNEQVSLGAYSTVAIYSLHAVCHAVTMLHMKDALNDNKVSEDIRLGTEKLEKNLKILLENINCGNRKYIIKQIKDRCSDGSTFWCVTLKLILTKWIKKDIDALKLYHSMDDSSLGVTSIRQILLPLLPKDEIADILAEESAKLSSLMDDPFSAIPCVSLISSCLSHLSDEQSVDTINVLFNVLIHWRENANTIFLFASDISLLPWEEVLLIVTVVRLITVIVKRHSSHLQHSYWDFILCSQSSWMQSLNESVQNIDKDTVVGMFCCAVCKCVGCVSQVMETLRVDKDMQEKLPSTLLIEWDEFFSPSVFTTLLPLFINFAETYDSCRNILRYCVFRCICIGVSGAGALELTKHALPPLFNPEDDETDFKLPEKSQTLLNHLCKLLLSNHPPTQYAAYCLLSTALPNVMDEWEKNTLKEDEEEDSTARPILPALNRIITQCGAVVEGAIGDHELGTDCVILPHTDAYLYSSAYLLGWSLVHKAIFLTTETSQHQYSAYLRERDLHQDLLVNLFKLMPQKPLLTSCDGSEQKDDVTMFSSELDILPTLSVSSQILSWLSCRVYYSTVTHLPAAVRLWWTNLDRHSQQIIDKFTRAYVSPLLIQQELSVVNSSSVKFDNMTIKARPGAREVIATYTIDESSMELVLRMAPNHPLSTVTVEDHKRVGVTVSQWRNTIFGLNIQLIHRNTPLVQSLEFWKRNIDQMFEGVEECYICYYVLHGTNHQLPKLLCRTCKKKFHSACLYKWFNTSSNSTCPLCRSLF